jgi:hypothetical protein
LTFCSSRGASCCLLSLSFVCCKVKKIVK